ncbi:hypothetical protein MKW92_017771 [Papaver armeniacum]|nr:hypothetical protein MKW92_017771 [Papaver armeniacum]
MHDVKCCPDKLYNMITRDAPQLSKYIPELVESVEVTATEEGNVCLGTGLLWKFVPGISNYYVGGISTVSKEKVTAVDNKNRSITSTDVIEGDVMTGFKSFKFNLDITPKSGTTDDGTTNEDVADPVGILKSCELMTTEMNFHLLKEA